MNALAFQILTVLVSAAGPATPENTLLTQLVEKGVVMPDGQFIRLPPPKMAEGLNADEQATVLAEAAALGKTTPEKFLENLPSAPVTLRVGKIPGKMGDGVIRTVNLYFVVYGDWNVLTSDEFAKGILKEGKTQNQKKESMVVKAGYLKVPDLGVRRLTTRSTPDLKEYFLYTTFNLFDRVELSETRFGMATRTPTGVIAAAKVDPRFAKDKEYPNLWRRITKNALGNTVLGPLHPYSGAGFYAKVTRLLKPENAIFVEFHQTFYEPQEWFGQDVNLMPSELRKIIPFEVKEFRVKLARATLDKAERKPVEEKRAEK